jgi:hypothetical protein
MSGEESRAEDKATINLRTLHQPSVFDAATFRAFFAEEMQLNCREVMKSNCNGAMLIINVIE